MRKKKKEAKMAGGDESMVLHNYDMPKATGADSSICLQLRHTTLSSKQPLPH